MVMLTPRLETLLRSYQRGHSNYLGVATPGVVKEAKDVEGRTVTVTVQPAVHKLVESEFEEDVDDVEEFVPLQDVPVCWLVGRRVQVNATLSPGDPVLLVCLDRDPSGWRQTGEASEPSDVRLHDWAHCVAIPGLVPNTSPFPTPGDAAALASRLDVLIGLIKTATTPATLAALASNVALYFPEIPTITLPPTNPAIPFTESTTGSSVLKISS